MRKYEKQVYPLPCEFTDKALEEYDGGDYRITKYIPKDKYSLYVGGYCVYQDKTMEEINEYLEGVYDDVQEQAKEWNKKYE